MKKNRQKLITYFALTAAGIINAFGITFFLYPVNLYDSGISGLSMLLAQITPDFMTLSFFLIVLNLPLFLYGYKRMGLSFSIRSVYAVCIYSLASWLITNVLPVDVSIASPLAKQDLLLCAIFGGLISGIGSGLTIRFGGAIDGIEVLSILFAKKLNLSIGTFVMIFNVILYIICGLVINSWVLPLYSIVTYAAALKTIDFIIEGFDRSKAAFIITTKPNEVCKALSDTFENGITTVDAKGYYSDSKKTMIYYVVNRFQVGKMKTIVHNIDPKAYISLNDVADIFPANKNDNGSNNSVDDSPTNIETPTLEEEIKSDLSEKLG